MAAIGFVLLLLAAFGWGALVCPRPERLDLEALATRVAVGLATLPLLSIASWAVGGPAVPGPAAVAGVVVAAAVGGLWWRAAVPWAFTRGELAVCALAAVHLGVYLAGAYRDPWLGGIDPWEHGRTTAYVLATGSLDEPLPGRELLHYTDAYPPAYDLLIAAAAWLGGSLHHALKGVGALLPSLAIPLVYALGRRLSGREATGWAAAALLAMAPGHLTHHVWSHALSIVCLFPGLIALARVEEDRRWVLAAAIAGSGVLLGGPTSAARVGFGAGAFAIASFARGRRAGLRALAALALGAAIAAVWWGPMVARYGLGSDLVRALSNYREAAHAAAWWGKDVAAGSLSVVVQNDYRVSWRWWVFPTLGENLPAPAGLGLGLTVLVLIGAVHAARSRSEGAWWRRWLLVWLGVTLFDALGPVLPVRFDAWRAWLPLSVQAALLGALGLEQVAARGPGTPARRVAAALVLTAATALPARLYGNLCRWGPKGFLTPLEMAGYIKTGAQLADGPVYPLSGDPHFDHLLCYDLPCPFWEPEVWAFQQEHRTWSPERMATWLREHGFAYVTLDAIYRRELGDEAFDARVAALEAAPGFELTWGIRDRGGAVRFALLKVRPAGGS